MEQFKPGDNAWITYDGSKALPVTILEVENTHYTIKIERPLKIAKGTSSLYLDEVRSTPRTCMLEKGNVVKTIDKRLSSKEAAF